MDRATVTSSQAAWLLSVLKVARGPMTAAELAKKLNLAGCRESQRRHVRAVIKYLRDNGEWIVATLCGGYWLTKDAAMWADYLKGRQIDAKRIIGESHKRAKDIYDGKGQGYLFCPGAKY